MPEDFEYFAEPQYTYLRRYRIHFENRGVMQLIRLGCRISIDPDNDRMLCIEYRDDISDQAENIMDRYDRVSLYEAQFVEREEFYRERDKAATASSVSGDINTQEGVSGG